MPGTILFVYGTLKRGLRNHHRLAGQTFLGTARTLPLYRLYKIDWYPGLVPDQKGAAIEGELWRVDEITLRELHRYEGVPKWFDRRTVLVEGIVDAVEAYFYQGDIGGKEDCGTSWRGEPGGSLA